MIAAAAYVLIVSEGRREILLDENFHSIWREEPVVAEPVPRFEHSRRAPLIVFGCFDDGAITHIADGRKGASAGTGLVRLNMRSLQRLRRPISFDEIIERSPPRIRPHLARVFSAGGKLPPKSLGATVDVLLGLEPQLSGRLARFSELRAGRLAGLTRNGRANLAVQKETVSVALDIAGIGTEDLLAWSPGDTVSRSFLEGLPEARVREDVMLATDYATVPGFEAIRSFPFAAREFESRDHTGLRLTVIMANRLPLEEQTGADLIYYNETYRSFIMVQYKAMEDGPNGPEFRWQLNDQLAHEIDRMDNLLEELKHLPDNRTPGSFRLHDNPFFLKLCPRMIFNPDDKGLFKGMYLPLDLWKCLAGDRATEGSRGGRVLTYRNAGRWLSNSEFITLAARAWIGTPTSQSALLERVIRTVLETGKTVTFAIKQFRPPPETHVGTVSMENPLDTGPPSSDVWASSTLPTDEDDELPF
jgi:hypothetical protein